MIEQRTVDDWKEVTYPNHLCTINLYPLDIHQRFGIDFFEYEEEGLGWLCATVMSINGIVYWLFSASHPAYHMGCIKDDPDANQESKSILKVTAVLRSYEPDPFHALTNLCDAFSLSEKDLYWKNDELTLATWALSRLDDNGNEIEMFRFQDRKTAEFVQKKYQDKGHKQVYFVRHIA